MGTASPLYAVVEDQHGAVLDVTRIPDDQLVDCDLWADRYADRMGLEVTGTGEPGVFGPDSFRLVIQREVGSPMVWDAKTYTYEVIE